MLVICLLACWCVASDELLRLCLFVIFLPVFVCVFVWVFTLFGYCALCNYFGFANCFCCLYYCFECLERISLDSLLCCTWCS